MFEIWELSHNYLEDSDHLDSTFLYFCLYEFTFSRESMVTLALFKWHGLGVAFDINSAVTGNISDYNIIMGSLCWIGSKSSLIANLCDIQMLV